MVYLLFNYNGTDSTFYHPLKKEILESMTRSLTRLAIVPHVKIPMFQLLLFYLYSLW